MVSALPCLAQVAPSPGVLPPRDCSYEGKAWVQDSYRIDGKVCQLCGGGQWVTRTSRLPGGDPKCSEPSSPPGDGSHLRIDPRYDCDANSAAPSSDRALRVVAGQCRECYTGSWRDVDRFFCNLPEIIVPKIPTLPPEKADGPTAPFLLGLKLGLLLKNYGSENTQAFVDFTARSKERLTSGAWVGSELFSGYMEWLQNDRPWDEQLALLRQWRAADPKSGAAALMEGSYWIAYAWFARGREFASKVPEEAFKTMRERMAKARRVLEEAKPYAASNPAWYVLMLQVALLQSWPMSERIALFDEAVKAEPLYDATYLEMATALTPRWGGSLDDYHRFVRGAVEKTKASYGDLMYARLYWGLIGVEHDKDPFKELKIPWQRMKSGFDDLMKRYPDSQWNLQNYAVFACRAGDGKTFNALLPKLTGKWVGGEPYTRDYCMSRFGKAGSR